MKQPLPALHFAAVDDGVCQHESLRLFSTRSLKQNKTTALVLMLKIATVPAVPGSLITGWLSKVVLTVCVTLLFLTLLAALLATQSPTQSCAVRASA